MKHTKPIVVRYFNALLHVVGTSTILLSIIWAVKLVVWAFNV